MGFVESLSDLQDGAPTAGVTGCALAACLLSPLALPLGVDITSDQLFPPRLVFDFTSSSSFHPQIPYFLCFVDLHMVSSASHGSAGHVWTNADLRTSAERRAGSLYSPVKAFLRQRRQLRSQWDGENELAVFFLLRYYCRRGALGVSIPCPIICLL